VLSALQGASLAIAILDSDLHYVAHSRAWCEMYDLGGADLTGRHHYDVFPEIPPRWRAIHARCLDGAVERCDEDRFVRSDGRVDWIAWEVRPWHTEDGSVGGLIMVSDRIEPPGDDQRVARVGTRRVDAMQEIARIGFWELDPVDMTVFWSRIVYELFGRDDGSGPPTWPDMLSMMHPEDAEHLSTKIEAMKRGDSNVFELDIRVPNEGTETFTSGARRAPKTDAGWLHMLVRGEGYRSDDGRLLRIIGTTQDVTEQRRVEQQLLRSQRMEAIGRLAGGIAHDFNNLLSAILGFSRFALEAQPHDSQTREDIEEVIRAAEQGRILSQQLLDISRKRPVRPEIFVPNELIERSARMLSRALGDNLQLELSLQDDLWSTRIDPSALEQVLMNLVVNARDAMPSGGKLSIETSNVELDDGYVMAKGVDVVPGEYICISVSDTGVGISEEIRDHIFEPFFTTKGEEGTGFGLSTCFGIVRQANGYIWVYSQPGEGTTFKVYLPQVTPDGTRRRLPPVDPTTDGRGSEPVLVVEDEPQILRIAERALRDAGYKVLAVGSCERALEIHATGVPIDILVTDIDMPEMNGIELAARMRETEPGLRVLFMSGYAEHAAVGHGVLAEDDALLPKPFTPTRLAQRVRQLLDEEA